MRAHARVTKAGVKFDDIELNMCWGCRHQREEKFSIIMPHGGGNKFVMLYY